MSDALLQGRERPALDAAAYLDVLNQRLQAHPMYLEGMAFPVASEDRPQAEESDVRRLPLAVMVGDTGWDDFGVYASVIDEVQNRYELVHTLPSAAAAPGMPCRAKASRLRLVPH